MLKWLLGEAPKIGSIWRFSQQDPFDDISVEVLDVKRGWVQYVFLPRLLNFETKHSASIRSFRAIYREVGWMKVG